MPSERNDIFDASKPTFGKPVISNPTPVLDDITVLIDITVDVDSFTTPPPLTPKEDNDVTGLGLFMVWQSPMMSDATHSWVRRMYSNNRVNQDLYNYTLTFALEAIDCPIFVRRYMVRRDQSPPYVDPTPRRSTLTTVCNMVLLTGGHGYTSAPTVTINGTGTGATAYAMIFNGAVCGIFLSAAGTGYTETPTVTLHGGGGTGASATAYVQPQNAILVSEEVQPVDDAQLSNAFVYVIQVYETIPGPPITSVTKGNAQLIPQEFLGKGMKTTTVTQTVDSTTQPDVPSGDLLQSTVEQQTVVKAIKKNFFLAIAQLQILIGAKTVTLNGGGKARIERSIVDEGTPVDDNLLMIESTVNPIGGGTGKAIKTNIILDAQAWPILTTVTKGNENLIPAEFRTLGFGSTETEQMVDPTTVPDTPSGDLLKSEVQQVNPFKAMKRNFSLDISHLSILAGKKLTTEFGGGISDVTKQIVADGTAISDANFLTLSEEVQPIGGGTAKSVKTKEQLSGTQFPTLLGLEYEEQFNILIPTAQQIIPANTQLDSTDAEIIPRDFLRSLKRSVPNPAALEAIDIRFPKPADVDLPDTLLSAAVIWSTQSGDGNSTSIGQDLSASAHCSAQVDGDITWELEHGFRGMIMGEARLFFLKIANATPEAILAKVGATSYWPVFRERTMTLILTGQSRAARIAYGYSSGSVSNSHDRDGGVRVKQIVIPRSLHKNIPITTPFIDGLASSTALVTTSLVGTPDVLYTALNETITVTPHGEVSPDHIKATAPTSFPTGTYIFKLDVSLFKWGFVQVQALTVQITSEHVPLP
jgi:hypothetical protein